MIALRPLLILLLLLGAGCGDDSFRIDFDGTPGTPISVDLRGWVPQIDAKVDGVPFTALVDTGSPLTVVTPEVQSGLPPGQSKARLEAFGLAFPGLTTTVAQLFQDSAVCDLEHPQGLIGGDLLRGFRLGLDYRGARAFLFAGDEADPPVASGTAAPQQVAIDVLGGGLAQLEGLSQPVRVEATRVAVAEVRVEGSVRTAVVDSGASLTVVSDKLLQELGEAGRPSLCCQSVATIYGTLEAKVSRLRQLELGSAAVKNVPVMVWEGPGLFDTISAEVGREVSLLVGGSFLRRFAVHLDYQGEVLELSRYLSQDHVDPDEFVGPGFAVCRAQQAAQGQVVVDVYQGSDAEAQGIKRGDRLLQVDGTSVAGMSTEQVTALLARPVGTTLNLTFAGSVSRKVKVERLLADLN